MATADEAMTTVANPDRKNSFVRFWIKNVKKALQKRAIRLLVVSHYQRARAVLGSICLCLVKPERRR